MKKETNDEFLLSESNNPHWLDDDDGITFKCKFCRKMRPVRLKSSKIGRCKLCNGE